MPGEVLGGGEGRVVQAATATPPARSPYPNEIVALEMQVDTPEGPKAAWAYTWSLQDRQPARGARLARGAAVRGTLIPFADAPPTAHAASRSELDARPSSAPLLWVHAWSD